MSRPRIALVPALVAVALLTFACSGGDDRRGAAGSAEDERLVRLIDRVPSAPRGTDAASAARRASESGLERVAAGEFWAAGGARRIVVQGGDARAAWSASVLDELGLPRDAVITIAPIDRSRLAATLVRVRLPVARAATDRPFAVEWSAASAKSIADESVPELMRLGATTLAPLSCVDGEGGVFEGIIARRPDAHVIAIAIASTERASDGASFEAFAVTERDAALQALDSAAADLGPHARRVTVGPVTCESIVIGAPGSLVVPVRVPQRSPRLTAEVAALATNRVTATITVRAAAGEAKRATVVASSDAFASLSLDLAEFAGAQVDVEFSGTVETAGAPPGLIAFGAPAIEGAPDDADRPDVVVISVDTLRADRVDVAMPRLLERAREFARFDRAFATAPWTLPSHVSLLSGDSPERHGVVREHRRIGPSTRLLAEDFRAAGWRTFAWTGGAWVGPEFGFDRGFERFDLDDTAYPDPTWVAERRAADPSADDGADCARARAALLATLSQERRAPRFVFLHSYVAHNYVAPRADFEALGARDAWTPYALGSPVEDLGAAVAAEPDAARRDALIAIGRARYSASVRVADRWVADVLDALDRAGRLERTIVIVTSDHGEELCERGRFGHAHSVSDEVLHVPLLIHGPGVAAGRFDDLVSLVDVAPTLRELCGLAPRPRGGVSLVPLLSGKGRARSPVLAQLATNGREIRVAHGTRFKLIETTPLDGAAGSTALFDLAQDAGERADVAPLRPDLVAELSRFLAESTRADREAGNGGLLVAPSAEVIEQLRQQNYLGGPPAERARK